jgi:hypothetical protein
VELRQALTALLLALLPTAALAEVERYAVVVGNDLGQPPDLPLRYAELDAARVVSVQQFGITHIMEYGCCEQGFPIHIRVSFRQTLRPHKNPSYMIRSLSKRKA